MLSCELEVTVLHQGSMWQMERNKLTEIFNIYCGLDMEKYGEGFYKNDSKAC